LIVAGYVKVGVTSEVPVGTLRPYRVGRTSIVVCNTGEAFYAVADECSHDSAPISDGKLDGGNIVCPRHGARFNVQSGAVTGPPAVIGIDSYKLKIEGEDILVMVD
jgi:3-phenylpropionate/trans-cinnamate dioxygenase ferredoxin subunit